MLDQVPTLSTLTQLTKEFPITSPSSPIDQVIITSYKLYYKYQRVIEKVHVELDISQVHCLLPQHHPCKSGNGQRLEDNT